ncbi:hypothetical protein EV182_005440, partial [Spiromyces aspiralis]
MFDKHLELIMQDNISRFNLSDSPLPSAVPTNEERLRMVLVTFRGGNDQGLNAWEIASIVMIVCMAVGLAFSVAINCSYFHKSRRRLRLDLPETNNYRPLPAPGLRRIPIHTVAAEIDCLASKKMAVGKPHNIKAAS